MHSARNRPHMLVCARMCALVQRARTCMMGGCTYSAACFSILPTPRTEEERAKCLLAFWLKVNESKRTSVTAIEPLSFPSLSIPPAP